ncbi:APC family permease [Nocardioides luteus]|uniref:APC family permease n=1 Tax=Nocardioides luteus TaxID=1844 RepID=UPI0018CB9CD0|nr:APC family permease [Nocardioides luteus]MBG6095811.1 amino acid transporter [Nocardioides luteus]
MDRTIGTDHGVPAAESTPAHGKLEGNLGVFHLVFTVMAFQAPIVAFLAYTPVAILLGNGLGTPVAFAIAGVILALFAVGLLAMAKHVPNPGGFYAFITAGLGRRIGLGSSLVAIICYYFTLVGIYVLIGVSLRSLCTDLFNGPEISWWLWALTAFVAVTVLGHFRMDVSANVLTVFLVAELALVIAYDIAVVARVGIDALSLQPLSMHNIFSGSLGLALMFGVGLYGGFEATLVFREEVRDPDRTIPAATYIVIALVAALFSVSALIFINAYGGEAVLSAVGNGMGSSLASMQEYVGATAMNIAEILLVTSSFAITLAAHNISARYLYNLGVDEIIHPSVGRAHAKHGSPYMASALVGLAVLAVLVPFTVSGSDPYVFYAHFVGVYSYSLLLLLFLTAVAVPAFLLRNRADAMTTVVNSIVCPVLSIIPLGLVLIMATKNFDLLIGGSRSLATIMLIGLYGAFAGGILLATYYKRVRPDVFARIGRQE